jgi:hypothetical protein
MINWSQRKALLFYVIWYGVMGLATLGGLITITYLLFTQ